MDLHTEGGGGKETGIGRGIGSGFERESRLCIGDERNTVGHVC